MSGRLRRVLTAAIVSAGATAGLVQAYAIPFRWNRGPGGRWLEPIRRVASRALGTVFDERAGPRPVSAGEYAGHLPLALGEAEELLWRRGFVRNPFSRLKVRDGEPEVGSWAYREDAFSHRQLHVMLFSRDGGVDVYAHEELSSVHPVVGRGHFDGTDQRVARGVRRARELLPLDTSDATVEPPEGAWNSDRAEESLPV